MESCKEIVDELRIRWLNFVYRHWASLSLIVTLLLGVGIRFLIHIFGYDPEGVSEVALDFTVGLFSLSVPVILTVTSLYPQLKALMDMLGSAEETGRETITRFVDEELRMLSSTVRKMRGPGAELDPVEVAKWVRRCFDASRGPKAVYLGTDSNVPSRYKKLYGDYLRSQEGFLEVSQNTSTRILVIDPATIKRDQNEDPRASEWFFGWHEKWKEHIQLMHIDPTKARRIADEMNLEYADVGIWEGKFALLFKPREDLVNLRMVFAGEEDYQNCLAYFRRLQKEADLVAKEICWFTDALSEHWAEFVVPEKRLEQEARFLRQQVLEQIECPPTQIRILDAAMGIGVETVFLLQEGYYVIGNEIEDTLRQKAKEYAQRKGVTLPEGQLTNANWLALRKSFGPNAFHLILVLGNSLCLLANPAEVKRALKNFCSLLTPEGVLVVDERNFQVIIDNWNEIKRNPWEVFYSKYYTGKIMYCGSEVKGVPTDKADGRIVFTYARVSDGDKPVETYGTLSMYPFKAGQLRSLLLESGFSRVEMYADLSETPISRYEDAPEADFYTYVAFKGGD